MWLVVVMLESPTLETLKEQSPVLTSCLILTRWEAPFSSGSGTAGLGQSRITLGQSPPLSAWRVAPLQNKGVGPDLSPRPHEDYGPESPRISSVIFNRAPSLPVPQFPHLSPEINTCHPPFLPLSPMILGEAQIRKPVRRAPCGNFLKNSLQCQNIFGFDTVVGGFSFLLDAAVGELTMSRLSSLSE